MATIGQTLTSPEAGWQRIDDNDGLFRYDGAWSRVISDSSTNYNKSSTTFGGATAGTYFKNSFRFKGTKLRLIGLITNNGNQSTDLIINIDGASYTFSNSGTQVVQALLFEKLNLPNQYHDVYITNGANSKYFWFDAIDIDVDGIFGANVSLVNVNGVYQTYESNNWQTVSTTSPTESDYLNRGMTDLSVISQSAWQQLTGVVELNFFCDIPNKTEVLFNIETNPFYLIDEWDGQNVNVIEYTDNPTQTKSTATLELVEPIMLADELGTGTVDVLYYTDNTAYTAADLEVTANYSPLDEIATDFEVVAWSEDLTKLEKTLTMKALPKGQLVLNPSDILYYGDIKSFITQTMLTSGLPLGKIRFVISVDAGTTWEVCRRGKWSLIDTTNNQTLVRSGMTVDEINSIPTSALMGKINGTTRLGYYIEDNIGNVDHSKISVVKAVANAPVNDVKFSDLAFYLLNTTATINLTFAGNKIKGVLDDADLGKVKYRVLLNGNPYFPTNGQFTSLLPSPQNINLVVDDRQIRFGESNTLRVEFEDYWGQVDVWSTNFIGTMSGLLFSDEAGNFYTTTFGEVLKKLDFGQIIAGQTTLDQKVILKNNLGYSVNNVRIESVQPLTSGVTVELSKLQSPFIDSPTLEYLDTLEADGSIDFFVRISTVITAEETPSGSFEFRVNADRIIE